jgi:hypothetical protein
MNKNFKIEERLSEIENRLSDDIRERLNESEHSGICLGECQSYKTTIKVRKMNCNYQHQDSNYVECCIECFEEIQAHWAEDWKDYWSGCL